MADELSDTYPGVVAEQIAEQVEVWRARHYARSVLSPMT